MKPATNSKKTAAAKPGAKASTAKPAVSMAATAKAADAKVVQKPTVASTKVDKKPAPVGAKPPAAKPQAPKPMTATNGGAPITLSPQQRKEPQSGHRVVPAATPKPAVTRTSTPGSTAPGAAKAAVAAPATDASASKKPVLSRHGFKTNESIVYPAHGVGRIIGIEEQEIAGITLELFVIQFEKDKMTLRVPTSKLASVGMRKLAEGDIVKKAMETLKGKARIKRTMWSRRAQEYEAKINSGDLVAIAEVVRDLYRSEAQPEQSYSERQLYEAALDRMAREIAAVDKVDERGAMQRITEVLSKSAKGRRAAEDEAAQSTVEIKAA